MKIRAKIDDKTFCFSGPNQTKVLAKLCESVAISSTHQILEVLANTSGDGGEGTQVKTRTYTASAYAKAAADNKANPPKKGEATEGMICDTTRAGGRKWGGWGWRVPNASGDGYTYFDGPGAEKHAKEFLKSMKTGYGRH